MEEIKALKDNEMWEVSDLPSDKKIVGCKWVFTTKFKPNGSIGDDSSEIKSLKEFISTEFELKDLGNLTYFLGMEVVRSKTDIAFGVSGVISQFMYAPREKHLEVAYKILRYLKGTLALMSLEPRGTLFVTPGMEWVI
ncbi:uncharacterized protein LOC120195526 [Hibiscus syriacus]|uniref:uncharacterized protein LOC120195526 n=1 Tax=Hibiscus syriacus TaxID=106335 RepID=UPI001922CCFD|nr:uncharacterized protein LOC120195526 [Hibiscus syriacus]